MFYSLDINNHLEITECGLDDAQCVIAEHHRTTGLINPLTHVRSYMAYYGPVLLGCITFSNPTGRWHSTWGKVLEVSRICFTPYHTNKKLRRKLYTFPSQFVDACCNGVSQEIPVDMFVTYIHVDESGKYLEHAGFEKAGKKQYSENSIGWNNRPNRAKFNPKDKLRYIRGVYEL